MPTPTTTPEAMKEFDCLLLTYVIRYTDCHTVDSDENFNARNDALTALRAHVSKMAEDGARLDWLEKRVAETFSDCGFGDGASKWSCTYAVGNRNDRQLVCTSNHTSIRAAIDTARRTKP